MSATAHTLAGMANALSRPAVLIPASSTEIINVY